MAATAPTGKSLVAAVYPALAAGDRAALETLLHPDFVAHFAPGMPVGAGTAVGRDDALAHWRAIGRAFAVRAEPEELLDCEGRRVVARGRYRGARRVAAVRAFDACFLHLWRMEDGRLRELHQVTDTARWT